MTLSAAAQPGIKEPTGSESIPARSARGLEPGSGNVLRDLDDSLNKAYPAGSPGCVVLIAREGKPLFRKAYGLANLELGVADSVGDLFALGSMTKQFTAMAILQLKEANALSLEDDIRKYLPDYNSHGKVISIRQLLDQTSGIEDFTRLPAFFQHYKDDVPGDEQVKVFEGDSLLFEPGREWSYSNSGYLLAGLIIERVSHMSYGQYLQTHIFQPLHMEHTCLATHDSLIMHLVSGYDPSPSGQPRPGYYYSWSWAFAAGGLISTVDDLLKWDEALYENAGTLAAQTSQILPDGEDTHYGLGWSVNQLQGLHLISHSGEIGGFLCFAIRIPERHIYGVILSNSTLAYPDDCLLPAVLRMAGIRDALALAASAVAPEGGVGTRPVAMPAGGLHQYAGTYAYHREHGRYLGDRGGQRQVLMKDARLWLHQEDGREEELIFLGKDEFQCAQSKMHVRFLRSAGGDIEAVETFSYPISFGPADRGRKIG